MAVEPQSGKIRAMVGGRDYRTSQFNRVVQSHRQPGSVFKPVTYLAALDETVEGGPGRFLPTTTINDAPFTWYYGGMSWSPANYKDRYFGQVTLQFALEESLNSATSRLAHEVGLHRIREMARKLGFGDLPSYPSIVLGGIEVTPMQVAKAYAILANGGLQVPALRGHRGGRREWQSHRRPRNQGGADSAAATGLRNGLHAPAGNQARHRTRRD